VTVSGQADKACLAKTKA